MKYLVKQIAALLLTPLAFLNAAGAAQPNSILADDWGWGDLSCHGHLWLKTQNLDKLAREGTDFQQFNVLNPVCPPSRNDVMTGHYPARYCVHQHFAAPAQNHALEHARLAALLLSSLAALCAEKSKVDADTRTRWD